MKKSHLLLIMIFIGLSLTLSACAVGPRVTGTPGVSIDGDQVFVSYGNFVRSIDASTGLPEWQFPEEANNRIMFYAKPYVTETHLYVGDVANNFYKLDKEGTPEWTFSAAKGFYIGQANVADGVVYAPNNDGNLYALDDVTGDLLWTFKTNHHIWAQPVVSDDTVFVASMDHFIYKVDKDGIQIWAKELVGAVVGTPVLSEDGKILFAGTTGKQVIALDTTTRDTKWEFDANGSLDSVWGDILLVDDVIIFSDSSGKIFALDAENATPKWQNEISGSVVGGVVAIPEGFALASISNEESLVRTFGLDGSTKWETTLNGEVFQAPVANDSLLVAGTINGSNLLYGYNLTGVQVWSYNPER